MTTASGVAVTSLGEVRHGSFSARVLKGVRDPFFRQAERSNSNVFLSARFVAAVEHHLLENNGALALVGVADETDAPVALFPFVKRRKFGMQVVEGLDFDITDYFAPALLRKSALTPSETMQVWQAAVKAVPGAHAVLFKKMPRLLHGQPHALTNAGFVKSMSASAASLSMRKADGSLINLDKVSVAREVRRKSKKFEQFGAVSLLEAETNEEVDLAMARLVSFRKSRFAELGRRDAMLDPRVVSFYRSLADRNQDNPTGHLLTLKAGDQVVAVVYGFSCGDVFTLIAPAITPSRQLQSGSPGLAVLYRTLLWCAEKGFSVFDLSVGSLFYKSRFDAQETELYEHHQALSPLGLPVVWEAALRLRVRQYARNNPALRERLERLARLGQTFGRSGKKSQPDAEDVTGTDGN
ncbi:MAG: GNAT family N-acetyltransferase [Rhizobiaceae bacterium]|nr:GNAT family N-acetyltransferase [Rhizobiaceae bacterium]